MAQLDRTSPLPQYQQLAMLIEKEIAASAHGRNALQTLAGGKPLTAVDIARHYQTQLAVTRKALALLQEKSMLEIRGEEVCIPEKYLQPAAPILCWDLTQTRFETGQDYEVRVLSKVMTILPQDLLKQFSVHGKSGHQASRITKLFLSDSQPRVLETILSPTNELPGLVMKDHRRSSIYDMIIHDYKKPITRVTQKLQVSPLSSEEAKILGSSEDFPCLQVQRFIYSEESLVAMAQWLTPGGRCSISDDCHSMSYGAQSGMQDS